MGGRQAALQQSDNLGREASKVYQDALVQLQRLEVVLPDLQGVQRGQVLLAPYLDDQHLHPCCISLHIS